MNKLLTIAVFAAAFAGNAAIAGDYPKSPQYKRMERAKTYFSETCKESDTQLIHNCHSGKK